ncbi:MAG: hydrogenase formation protein HypD [Bacteroidales bacterium]
MKYIDEYRKKELVEYLIEKIHKKTTGDYTLMEVCGSHTMAIHRFGLPSLLPSGIHLVSGPGCPVCVTGKRFIDQAVAYSNEENFIVTTYGDLMRVPGSVSSLEKAKAAGGDIRIIYSPLDALNIAKSNPDKTVVFPAIGFETTAPGTAVVVDNAERTKIDNFLVLSGHKVMPPAMDALVVEGVKIDGYICPGHVSTITGSVIYKHIPEKYGIPCVISGFEPVDILYSILMIITQIENNDPKVEIQYKRAVKPGGNPKALEFMDRIFYNDDDYWRGLGTIENSGLKLRNKYNAYNAEYVVPIEVSAKEEDQDCICGEILKGLKNPLDCKLFASKCNPMNPVGACMVSSEGACQAFYKYNRHEKI